MEDMNANGHRPETNQLIRRDLGGTSISRDNHATSALVAKARAEIEARYSMAIHRPRNMDEVRTSILKECRRPGFAAAAIYRKPVGDGVEGLSIRFAEAAARCFGNIAMEVSQIYDDENSRVMRVSATDLEANIVWPQDVTVAKTVERKTLRKGQRPVGERTNSYGDRVYLVEASEDDLLNKQGALVSKALRTCILRIIPGNLQDEAYDVCNAILKDTAAKDPDAARNAMADAFSGHGIQPTDLEEWLGHKLDMATPPEIEQLRRLFVAIRDGEATWPEALAQRAEQIATKAPKSRTEVAAVKAFAALDAKGTSAVKDKIKGRKPDQAPKVEGDSEKEPGWMAGPPSDER